MLVNETQDLYSVSWALNEQTSQSKNTFLQLVSSSCDAVHSDEVTSIVYHPEELNEVCVCVYCIVRSCTGFPQSQRQNFKERMVCVWVFVCFDCFNWSSCEVFLYYFILYQLFSDLFCIIYLFHICTLFFYLTALFSCPWAERSAAQITSTWCSQSL